MGRGLSSLDVSGGFGHCCPDSRLHTNPPIRGKKRGRYETNTDERWLAAWTELQIAKAQAAHAAEAPERFAFEEIEGESKNDRRKRYARESQKFRYANDPEFAAKRRESSKRSHAKAAQS